MCILKRVYLVGRFSSRASQTSPRESVTTKKETSPVLVQRPGLKLEANKRKKAEKTRTAHRVIGRVSRRNGKLLFGTSTDFYDDRFRDVEI